MIGAIIGDIVGSRFEFVEDGNHGKNFVPNLLTKNFYGLFIILQHLDVLLWQ